MSLIGALCHYRPTLGVAEPPSGAGASDSGTRRIMNVVKLGRKGQVSIPKAVLDALHLDGEYWLIVDTTDGGAIVLRPAGVAPIELQDDARIEAFLEEDKLTPELATRVGAALAARRRG